MATGIPIALANTMKSSSNEKPFTYLPGGLDFSEIRIPGLAKRIGKQQQQQGLSRTSVAAEDIQNQNVQPQLASTIPRGSSVPRIAAPHENLSKNKQERQKSISDLLSMPMGYNPDTFPNQSIKRDHSSVNQVGNSFTPLIQNYQIPPVQPDLSISLARNPPLPPPPPPALSLPPVVPRHQHGRVPPAPPPPPPGYLTDDLLDQPIVRKKMMKGKIGFVHAQLEQERQSKKLLMDKEKLQREAEEEKQRQIESQAEIERQHLKEQFELFKREELQGQPPQIGQIQQLGDYQDTLNKEIDNNMMWNEEVGQNFRGNIVIDGNKKSPVVNGFDDGFPLYGRPTEMEPMENYEEVPKDGVDVSNSAISFDRGQKITGQMSQPGQGAWGHPYPPRAQHSSTPFLYEKKDSQSSPTSTSIQIQLTQKRQQPEITFEMPCLRTNGPPDHSTLQAQRTVGSFLEHQINDGQPKGTGVTYPFNSKQSLPISRPNAFGPQEDNMPNLLSHLQKEQLFHGKNDLDSYDGSCLPMFHQSYPQRQTQVVTDTTHTRIIPIFVEPRVEQTPSKQTPPPAPQLVVIKRKPPVDPGNSIQGVARVPQLDNVFGQLKSSLTKQQSVHENEEPGADIEKRIMSFRRASEPPDARNAVNGEFARYAGGRPSVIAQRKKPSQSPSMYLLGRTYIKDKDLNDGDGEIVEGTSHSQEYTGDQGRYLPPRPGKQRTNFGGSDL